jgi:hypothetical protein
MKTYHAYRRMHMLARLSHNGWTLTEEHFAARRARKEAP